MPALEFLDRIKAWMHELTGVPETSLGQEQAISNTSGVALAIQYFPTMLKYQLKKIQYGTGIMQINEMILRTLFVFEPGCVYYDQATEGIKRPEQPDFIDPSDPQVYHNEITWPEPLPTDVLVKLNELMVKLQLGLESKKGALKDLGEQFPDEKLQELWLEQIDDLNMDAAKRIKTAQIDAAIIALTGIVPEGAGEPVDGAETTETETRKPDGTKTTQTKQTTPGVSGPTVPNLPGLDGLQGVMAESASRPSPTWSPRHTARSCRSAGSSNRPDDTWTFRGVMSDRITVINTKQDMARFARAHESEPITWSTQAGPGGTIIVTEHDDD